MIRFPSIDGLYVRNPQDHPTRPNKITAKYKHPVYKCIKDWWVEEKLDGTNIRLVYNESGGVEVRGRSDAAQVHGGLAEACYAAAPGFNDTLAYFFPPYKDGRPRPEKPVTLYGEGIGPGINNNALKLDTHHFVLFDVKVGADEFGGWLAPEHVHTVARELGLLAVPVRSPSASLLWAEEQVRHGVETSFFTGSIGTPPAGTRAEGLVLKCPAVLYNQHGALVRLKIKPDNIPNLATKIGESPSLPVRP